MSEQTESPQFQQSNVSEVLDRLVDEIAHALQSGQSVDVDVLVREHPELAERLRRLIPSMQVLTHLGDSLASSCGRADHPTADAGTAPAALGDYRILGEIGRGGMGVVYEAEQLSMQRKVALKVLPFAAMLDRKALLRFQNEVRAAAMLEHPNIVPVYAVGEERGVHYFAMRLIHGRNLAALLEERRNQGGQALSSVDELVSDERTHTVAGPSLPAQPAASSAPEPVETAGESTARNRAALSTSHSQLGKDYYASVARLGIQAADGLQHAHEQGILHRDIKPSNLLLDNEGQLYITDFGLARIMSQAGITISGDIVGTLRYMSPQQALGRKLPLDNRTDIYSLGATLYELLTFRPAFDGADRQALLRQISDEEPPRLRRISPGAPRDLETIVLKAMRKEPEERYATARELSDDLRRYLADEPIRAKRPTLVDRTFKWSRRHRGLVAAALVLLLMATISLSVSNLLIDRQRARAELERERADDNFHIALDAVDNYLTKISESERLQQSGMLPLRKELLEQALGFYQQFIQQRNNDPTLEHELARAYARVGTINDLLGSASESIQAHRQAMEISTRLLAQNPRDTTLRHLAAKSYFALGLLYDQGQDYGQAVDAYRSMLAILRDQGVEGSPLATTQELLGGGLNGLGSALTAQGDLRGAEAAYQQALVIRRQLVEDQPQLWNPHCNLGGTLSNLARSAMQRKERDRARELVLDAIQQQQLAQQLNPDSRVSKAFLCKHYFILYETDRIAGDLKAAEQTLKSSLEVAEEMARDFPDVAESRHLLAEACRRMGWLLASNTDRTAEAEQMMRRAVDVSESLAADFPQTREHAYEVAVSLNLLSANLQRQQKYDESLEVAQRAVVKLETLIGSGGSAPRYWVLLGTIHNDASMMLLQRQLWSDADRMLERAVKGLEQLPPASRATPFCDHLLGALFNNLAISRSEMGQPKEACDFARQAIAYQHAALDRCTDAARAEYRRHLSNHHYLLAACLLEAAEFSEVISHYRKSLEFGDWEGYRCALVAGLLAASSRPELQDVELAVTLARKAVASEPTNREYLQTLGVACYRAGDLQAARESLEKSVVDGQTDSYTGSFLALVHHSQGELLARQKQWDEAIAQYRQATELEPDRASTHYLLGNALGEIGRVDESIAAWTKAIELDPQLSDARHNVTATYHNLGLAHSAKGETDEAIADYRKSVALQPDFAEVYNNLAFLLQQQGQREEAITLYRKAIEKQPQSAGAHNDLGNVLKAAGQLDAAVAAFRRAVEIEPGNVDFLHNLAEALIDKGPENEAREAWGKLFDTLRQTIQQKPNEASAYNTLAWSLATVRDPQLRNPAEAVQLATKAVELEPANGGLHNTLGVAYYRAQKWQEAITSLQKSMEMTAGGDANDWFFLAMAYGQMSEPKQARDWFRKAVDWTKSNDPQNLDLLRVWAEAAGLLGEEPPVAESENRKETAANSGEPKDP